MKKNVKIENTFLLLSLFLGIIFVLIIPPFQSPDEDSHFLKSFLISKGDFYPDEFDDIKGYKIPSNLNNYIADKNSQSGNLDFKYDYKSEYYDQLLEFSYNDTIIRDISTSSVTPVAHVVPALGIFFAKLHRSFNSSDGSVGPIVLLQFARLSCLIIYSIICYFAIKNTPKFKISFFTILLLPSVLILRSSVTYDSLLIAITALSLSKMLQLYYDDKYNFKILDLFIFIICGYILLNVKTVYSIVFLLMFFIPGKKFGGIKKKIKYFIIMICSVIGLTLLLKIPYFFLPSGSDLTSHDQLMFIIHNPIKYTKILFNNIFNNIYIQTYWMVGTYGLLDTYIQPIMIDIIYLNLIFIMIIEAIKEKCKFPFYISLGYLILTVLSIAAIYTSLYIIWTPNVLGGLIGGSQITGVQGRYFLPLLLVIPLIISNGLVSIIPKKIQKINNKIYNYIYEYYYFIPLFTNIIAMIVIIRRFII